MVRKVATLDGDGFPFRQARARIIERLVKPIRAACSCLFQAAKGLQGGGWSNHGRKRGGIRGNDNILAESPFEPQSRNPKAGVLIVEVEIAGIVRGFRHSPRCASL